jgi:hypothetical protein
MTALDKAVSPADGMHGVTQVAPLLFAATLFVSAFLLFSIQPMFTKMVLPLLGGAPTVWSIALVFFQATLLGGYAYAHLIVRRIPLGIGALIHFGTLAAAAMMLPIRAASSFGSPPTDNIAFWLIGLFAVSIGLPFAVLATTAPLLQRWFSASGHSRASNPYVLYAASNLGSFAGLFACPTLIEPFVPLHAQAWMWSAGFAAFALLVATAGLFIARHARPLATASEPARVPTPDRLFWMALAAIPTGLVIAVPTSPPILLPRRFSGSYRLRFICSHLSQHSESDPGCRILPSRVLCRSPSRRYQSDCSAASALIGSRLLPSISRHLSCLHCCATANFIDAVRRRRI